MQPCSTLPNSPVLASGGVAKRPVFSQELGEFFEKFRTAKRWSLRTAAMKAKARVPGTPLTYGTMYRWESGRAKNFKPEHLKVFAELYGLDYIDLLKVVMPSKLGITAQNVHAISTEAPTLQAPEVVIASVEANELLLRTDDVGIELAVYSLKAIQRFHPRDAGTAGKRRAKRSIRPTP